MSLTRQPKIVVTVDELMAPCTRLDLSLASPARTRRPLYGLLAEAPANAREIETAE
jgi:hypothetical protein